MTDPMTHYRVVLQNAGQQSLSEPILARFPVEFGVGLLKADTQPFLRPVGVWRIRPKFRGEFERSVPLEKLGGGR